MRDHTAVEESMVSSRTVPTTLAFVCALMLAGCATPVGVKHMSPDAVRESLTRNVLSQGKLSLPTENFLRRLGADEHYRRDPEQVLSVLHDTYVRFAIRNTPEAQNALVSLAEIAFHHGSKADDPKYFLSAVAYAWAYLFPSSKELKPHPMDPRLRLAIDLYNRGISRAFADKDTSEIVFESGLFETGFGGLNIQLDDRELQWGDRRLSVFISVAEFEVRGLRNRYRWRGLGTPLAAVTQPLNPDDTDDFFVKNMRVPASAVMTFDDFDGQLESGVLDARMHLRVAYTSDSIEINGETIGLEMEPTSSFAFMLQESDPWERELKGLFQGDLEVKGSGLTSLEPYRPGQIPVILVHGTASSAARWADILNDLTNDRRIREHYQFWLFTYNTGNPVAYSAWKLRTGIRSLVDRIDPEHRDSALDQIVVVGHSQGGLLAKMTVVDTGDVLWKMVSDRSIEEMDLEPESREILGGSLFVEPVPEVKSVVFISTPHHGSHLANSGAARWMSRMIRAPANLVRVSADFISQNAQASGIREVDRADGAIGNMDPSSPFLAALAELPIAPGVSSHSIISVKGGIAEPEESDGVVKYKSAHIEGVDSELVVDSGHSCQSDPIVIAELRRILLVHLGEDSPEVRRLFPK